MTKNLLKRLGIRESHPGVSCGDWSISPQGGQLVSINPSTGQPLGSVQLATGNDYAQVVKLAESAFQRWRIIPPPSRGEVVRRLGQKLREKKEDLGLLVTLETGKIKSEGLGEVQEMIDICDFAVGLSRQLYGLTIASERPMHRMFEQWHPLGPIGIITAFNFPVAVWAWNAAIAAVCGNTMVWKPAPQSPLTAIAVQNIVNELAAEVDCAGVFNLCIGDVPTVGEAMLADRRLPLISATGSCALGKRVAEVVGKRLGKTILELGGNNGILVAPSADQDLALRAVLFAAAGTAGQRCTTLRRLLLHRSLADSFTQRLVNAYQSIRIGNPWEEGTLMGPLIDESAVTNMMAALDQAKKQGGEVLCGGERIERDGYFVQPTIVRATPDLPIMQEETFAPILYVLTHDDLDQAIAMHNSVRQGFSSAIFTNDLREAERFLSAAGSDCGIANVNIGTSGAEIGGAFGGEKETGGGREAGSDAWRGYMRRQTCTINYGGELPLAQGVKFEVEET